MKVPAGSGGAAGSPVAAAGAPSNRQIATARALPWSNTSKSAERSPVTGIPFLSTTVTETSTSLVAVRNAGGTC